VTIRDQCALIFHPSFAAAAEAKQFTDWPVEEDDKGLKKKTIEPGCGVMPWTRYDRVGLNITMLIMPQIR